MRIRDSKKIKIAIVLIVTLLMQSVSYAAGFIEFFGIKKYITDDGSFATGWRWLDTDGNGLCECYRFNPDGTLVTNTTVKGKEVNAFGQWVVDGVVQQVYKSTGRPYSATSKMLEFEDDNKYIDMGTMSNTKRINATKKDIKLLLGTSSEPRHIGPDGKFEVPEDKMVYGKGTKKVVEKRPIATRSSWGIIADALEEEKIIILTSTESIIAGRDMRPFKTSSSKYTEKADKVKIYGGDVWDDTMVLQGNGAYVKFSTTDTKSNNKSKFKANYFIMEVAHQTHGESTADTYCAIEVYTNGKSVATYDDFCDGKPETIEMWLDDNENNVEFRAIVTGDAPGRKIYIRNARFRQIKEKEDK